MAGKGTVVVKFVGDTRDLKNALGQVEGGLGKSEKGFQRFGRAAKVALVGAGVALGAFAKSSISAASDTEESLSKARTVFGAASGSVEAFAKTAAKNLGISRQAALESTATFGNLFTAMQFAKQPAADMSTKLVKLAADMASFNNADPKEVLENLRAGLLGEAEPLRKFGVQLSAERIELEALNSGLVKNVVVSEKVRAAVNAKEAALKRAVEVTNKYGKGSVESRQALDKVAAAEARLRKEMGGKSPKLSAATKAQAAYNIIMKDTKVQQGDVERTGGSLANQQRKLSASVADLKANLGKGLLPVAVKITSAMMRLAGWFDRNRSVIVPLVAVVGGLAAAVWAVGKAVKAYTAVQAALNVVMAMNPIGAVILALVALGASLYLLWTRSETFRRIVTGAFNGVKTAAVAVFNWIKGNWPYLVGMLAGPFGLAVAAIYKNWRPIIGFFKKVLGGVAQAFASAFNIINGIMAFGKSMVDWLIGAVQWLIDKVQEALGPLGKVADAAGKVAGAVGGAAKGAGGFLGKLDPRAHGGPVSTGNAYLVGERGPEMFVPGANGTIIPNGGGGVTVNVYAGAVGSEDFLARAVTTALQRQMSRGFRPGLT